MRVRSLSQTEIGTVETTLDEDRFWQLQTDEPEHGCCYDGPLWMIESRAPSGYHKVMRAWDREPIMRLFACSCSLRDSEASRIPRQISPTGNVLTLVDNQHT
jgi:hypothetical protein